MVEATAPTVPHVSIHINGKLAELSNFHFLLLFSRRHYKIHQGGFIQQAAGVDAPLKCCYYTVYTDL